MYNQLVRRAMFDQIEKKDKYLGKGGFSKVYLAEKDGIPCAFKKIRLPLRNSMKSILSEINTMRFCRHPNIIEIYGMSLEGFSSINLCLEYADGGTIYNAMYKTQGSKIPFQRIPNYSMEKQLLFYIYQISQVLMYLKEKNIYHRDLKPDNILITSFGLIKVADFGVSKFKTSEPFSFAGTPAYTAPQVFQYECYSFSAEVWSLGITLFNLTYNKLPYRPDDLRSNKGSLPELEIQKKEFSTDFLNLMKSMLNINPQDRINAEDITAHPSIKKYEKDFKKKYNKLLQTDFEKRIQARSRSE